MNLARKLALFLAIAATANLAAVMTLPRLINVLVLHRMEQLAGGVNRALPAPRADASARAVVRPSPDLLYTVCVFDVSTRPLRITAPVQDSYVSVSGFAADTDNFFAINDAELEPDADGVKRFDLVVARSGVAGLPAGARAITAPSDKGLILFRSLITRDADVPGLQREFQARQRCESM